MLSSPSSPRQPTSLTDELAAATNELLDLGSHASKRPSQIASYQTPLPTPSPLNLASNGDSASQTLSSIISAKKDARLELIYDDDEDAAGPSPIVRQGRVEHPKASSSESAALPYDCDDNLPSSRLSSLIASVSNDTNFSNQSMPSPRLPVVEEVFNSQEWPSAMDRKGHRHWQAAQKRNAIHQSEPTARHDHTPTFFAESFPDAQRSPGIEGIPSSSPEVIKQQSVTATPPPMLGLSSPKTTKATLGDISDSQVTVKLHGNARLERESLLASPALEGDSLTDFAIMPETILRLPMSDEGDRSSLISLPATSLTDSTNTSNRMRPRARSRKSNGSYSLLSENLDTADDLPFARDIQIRGFTVVGEKARGFVCYDVRVITTRGTTISILRRFSSFVSLKASLALERPQYATLIPTLPPKRSGILHKYASHHLEKRRRGLQKWLSVVMLDRRWATAKALQEWVVGDSDVS